MRRSALLIILCAAFGLGSASVLSAQQMLYLPTERQTNGQRVRAAFQELAQSASGWTVEIKRGKATVAMGVVIDSNGLVLTKLSEVKLTNARSALLAAASGDMASLRGNLVCNLSDDQSYEAKLVATDPESDLALLHIAANNLPVPEWGGAGSMPLGSWVVTPSISSRVMAVGIVSAQSRDIPAEKRSGVLGVQLERVSGAAKVVLVFENSGAEKAGLKTGDLITHCNDREITDGATLTSRLRQMKPGDEVVLKIRRGEKHENVTVVLTHPFGVFLSQFAMQNRMGTELSDHRDGFSKVFSHDSQLDPEDCGGPLLDSSGRIIGINIARAGRTECLALPVEAVHDAIRRMRTQMIETASNLTGAEEAGQTKENPAGL